MHKKKLLFWVGTGAYSGLSPVMPGTMGSLVGVVLFLGVFSHLPALPYLLSLLGLYAVGVLSSRHIDEVRGGHDNQCIVIDEIVGVLLVLFLSSGGSWETFAGFVLFRIFDIAKIYPANYVQDALHDNPHGVMLDDVVAGVYGFLSLRLLAAIFG